MIHKKSDFLGRYYFTKSFAYKWGFTLITFIIILEFILNRPDSYHLAYDSLVFLVSLIFIYRLISLLFRRTWFEIYRDRIIFHNFLITRTFTFDSIIGADIFYQGRSNWVEYFGLISKTRSKVPYLINLGYLRFDRYLFAIPVQELNQYNIPDLIALINGLAD